METTILDDDLLRGEQMYALASKGKRFTNYLIDLALFYVCIVLISAGLILAEIDIFAVETISPIMDRIISAILLAIYYIIIESSLNGKTVGKYITKTRAVQIDGSPLTMSNVLSRSFSRIVPFEGLSFLGSDPNGGWHDKWSETKVIDETKLVERPVKKILEEE